MATRSHNAALHIVFVKPAGFDADWERTDTWTTAEQILALHVVCDPNGAEANRFGAKTSGEALLFTADGRLVFDGGLTSSRGHEGENPACDAMADLLDGGAGEFRQMPVFGCALSDQCTSSQ